jgi:hypothetical protein
VVVVVVPVEGAVAVVLEVVALALLGVLAGVEPLELDEDCFDPPQATIRPAAKITPQI